MARATKIVAGGSETTGPDPAQSRQTGAMSVEEEQDPAKDLTFRQAQAALDLCLAQLQASDLDVEAMADLYRRARSYAERCEDILMKVEQEVLQWDPERPAEPPHPYHP